jgi:hypothetical protein
MRLTLNKTIFNFESVEGRSGFISVCDTRGRKWREFYTDDYEWDFSNLQTVGRYLPNVTPEDMVIVREVIAEINKLDRQVRDESADWAADEMMRRFGYSHDDGDECFQDIKSTARERFYNARVAELAQL